MSQHNAEAVYDAIREAVVNAVSLLGIESLRNLSMFPSVKAESVDQKEAA